MSTFDLLPTGVLVGLAGVLGLLVGSFLNVVVYRVPAGLSVVNPPSACPGCGHELRKRDNVPVVSWLLLRGKCRDCKMAISARYPLVELATGLAFALTAWRFSDEPVVLAAALVIVGSGIALALIDIEHHRLPFVITIATTVMLGVVLLAGALTGADIDWTAIGISVAGWFGVYGGLSFGTGGRAMGYGDAALAPALGIVLGLVGWPAAMIGLFGSFVIGAFLLVPFRLAGKIGRRVAVPQGPFMLAGTAVGLFAGAQLVTAYTSAVGLA